METATDSRKWLRWFTTGRRLIGVGLLLIIVGVVLGDEYRALEDFGLIGAGTIALGVVYGNVQSIRFPGGIEAVLRDLNRKVEEDGARIDRLFLLAMSPQSYAHLKNFDQGIESIKPYEVNSWVRAELQHLHDLGYIEMIMKDQGVRDIPDGEAVELAEYVRMTAHGREYVALRGQADAGTANGR